MRFPKKGSHSENYECSYYAVVYVDFLVLYLVSDTCFDPTVFSVKRTLIPFFRQKYSHWLLTQNIDGRALKRYCD